MSFRRRLVLLVAGAVVLVGAAVLVSAYFVVRGQLLTQVEQELRAAAAVVASAASDIGRLPGLGGPSPQAPPIFPRIIDAEGRVVETRGPEVGLPVTSRARSVAAGTVASTLESLEAGSDDFAVFTISFGPGRAVQVAKSLSPVQDTLRGLLRTSLIAGGGIVLLAPLIGYVVAGGALVPVRRLSRTAEGIAHTADLQQRAEVQGDDELASLAASFNSMLDRLETVVEALERAQRAQRQLVADASHELQTPLTTVRANVELLAITSEMPVDQRAELAADTRAQIDDLSVLMSQLIDLAREDEREPERIPVRLDQVVEEVLDRTRPRYPRVSFTADLESTTVSGARDSLDRAVVNLLDNAAKWSPDGATVEVRLSDGTLEVRDRGPGIDESDLPHVFQRFYRGARTRGTPGSGLGLAIVGQVVASHEGEVWAEHPPGGGALFKMRLPIGDS